MNRCESNKLKLPLNIREPNYIMDLAWILRSGTRLKRVA